MQPLEVRIPHGLDHDELRRRLDRAVTRARDEYGATVGEISSRWEADDRMRVGFTALGMEIDATLELRPQELLVRVTLPALATMFAGRIRSGIEERLGGLLAAPVVG